MSSPSVTLPLHLKAKDNPPPSPMTILPFNLKIESWQIPNSIQALCSTLSGIQFILEEATPDLDFSGLPDAFQGTLILASRHFNASLLEPANVDFLPWPLSLAPLRSNVKTIFIDNTEADRPEQQVYLGNIVKIKDLFPSIERAIILVKLDEPVLDFTDRHSGSLMLHAKTSAQEMHFGTVQQYLTESEEQAGDRVSITSDFETFVIALGGVHFEEGNEYGYSMYTGQLYTENTANEHGETQEELKVQCLERMIQDTYVSDVDETIRTDPVEAERHECTADEKRFCEGDSGFGRFVLDHVLT